jgi:hypothetical protein
MPPEYAHATVRSTDEADLPSSSAREATKEPAARGRLQMQQLVAGHQRRRRVRRATPTSGARRYSRDDVEPGARSAGRRLNSGGACG